LAASAALSATGPPQQPAQSSSLAKDEQGGAPWAAISPIQARWPAALSQGARSARAGPAQRRLRLEGSQMRAGWRACPRGAWVGVFNRPQPPHGARGPPPNSAAALGQLRRGRAQRQRAARGPPCGFGLL